MHEVQSVRLSVFRVVHHARVRYDMLKTHVARKELAVR